LKNKALLLILLFVFNFAYADKLEMSGVFLGKNIYVMNPFSDSGVGFCVYEVTVNGQTSTDEINSSAFEIDLSQFNFALAKTCTLFSITKMVVSLKSLIQKP